MPTTLYIRAPDHLGDGVMALEAMRAIARMGTTTVDGPGWVKSLLGVPHHPATKVRNVDVAVLFKPSWSAAWHARGATRRIGMATDGRWPLLTDAVHTGNRHRIADYTALARIAGATPGAAPRFVPAQADRDQAPTVEPDTVLLLPASQSMRTVGWAGYRALADALAPRPVLFAAGPGEDAQLGRIAGPHPVVDSLDLGPFAALVAQVAAVIGNDSGLTHLAAAVMRGIGRDPARVHVVYGSTTPQRTGPPGTTAHLPARLPCQPCYAKRCMRRDPTGKAPCLQSPIAPILAGIEEGR